MLDLILADRERPEHSRDALCSDCNSSSLLERRELRSLCFVELVTRFVECSRDSGLTRTNYDIAKPAAIATIHASLLW